MTTPATKARILARRAAEQAKGRDRKPSPPCRCRRPIASRRYMGQWKCRVCGKLIPPAPPPPSQERAEERIEELLEALERLEENDIDREEGGRERTNE